MAAVLVMVAVAAWLYKENRTALIPAVRVAAQPSGRVVSVFLTSIVTRERNAVLSVVLPKGTEQLRVTASVPMVTHDTPLQAELRSATGSLLWQGTPQSWDADSPVFLIPANRTPAGAAELDVFAGADRRLAGVYPLRFERF
ncbi:MAG TPA: hypothetical protein VFC21_08300 [Bryobacteraceae bacterium]|nr:hypothetical protein [Bryobacteraceae bacterium]